MPKRRRKANPATNRNWLLFRVAGSITVLKPHHFEGETLECRELAVKIHNQLLELQCLLKGQRPEDVL